MANIVKTLMLLLVVYSSSLAQEKIIYLEEVNDLFYPKVARTIVVELDHKLTFDVVDLKPQNIILTPLQQDTLYNVLLDSSFFQNLDSLTFVNDTTNYSIFFDVEIARNLSRSYVEFVKQGHIRMVVQIDWPAEDTGCELFAWLSTWNPVDASITISGTVVTRKNVHWPSDIIVECFFADSTTKAVIVKNNMPVLEKEILKASAWRTKKHFLRQNASKEDSVKHYYIVFNVLRRFGKRGFSKVY